EYMGNYRKPASITLMLASHVKEIRDNEVVVKDAKGTEQAIPNDAVFTMIGREAPLDFFRRSGVRINGERTVRWWITLVLFLIFCIWMYHWKKSNVTITDVQSVDHVLDVGSWWQKRGWFPYNIPPLLGKLGEAWNRPSNLLGVINNSLGQPGF